jgi:hypothetical protein
MFHDELMKDRADFEKWHYVYGRLSDAVDVSLAKFLEVLKDVEAQAYSTGKDIHAVTLLLMYEFAEPIDGVSILVRKGSAKNCCQLLRTAFEVGLGLRYILEDAQTYERRLLAYEYFHLLDGLKYAQKCNAEHETGKQLRRELEGDQFADLFDIKAQRLDIKKQIDAQEKKLNSTRYAVVRAEIDRIKTEKKNAKKAGKSCGESASNWFSLWGGPKDVRSLAVQLRLLSLYESLYRPWSNATHGEGALKRLGGPTNDGMVSIDPIRSPVGLPDKCVHACNLTNGLALTVVDKLVPHLRESMKGWFIEHMKPAMEFLFNTKIG